MEGSSACVRIHRASSIEKEPRTLNIDQLRFAREAALYVLNTKSMEEAMNIFTKGLRPVGSDLKKNTSTMMDVNDREVEYSADELRPRDIATAPF